MTDPNPPVVALIERRGWDDEVMREARARTAALAAPLLLVHVRRPVRDTAPWSLGWRRRVELWQRTAGIEATVRYDLRLFARQWIGPATPVDVVVRFGDPLTELVDVARAREARVVVAASRPLRWPPGWARDTRLRWALDRPLVLVRPTRASRWTAWLEPVPAEARRRP